MITYFFRQATRRVYRVIRNTVSQLNQNLQENLSGMQVVQLSNREARNLSRIGKSTRKTAAAKSMPSSWSRATDHSWTTW